MSPLQELVRTILTPAAAEKRKAYIYVTTPDTVGPAITLVLHSRRGLIFGERYTYTLGPQAVVAFTERVASGAAPTSVRVKGKITHYAGTHRHSAPAAADPVTPAAEFEQAYEDFVAAARQQWGADVVTAKPFCASTVM